MSLQRAVNAVVALAPERELFLRTGGQVRFLRISTKLQLTVAGVVLASLLAWGAGTLVMLWDRANLGIERAALDQDREAVSHQAAQVNAYRKSVDEIASDIAGRQDALDELMRVSFGANPDDAADGVEAQPKPDEAAALNSGASSPETERLARLQQRQSAFEARLMAAAQIQLDKVEGAIRSFGLNPERMAGDRSALGGPFKAAEGLVANDPQLRDLALLLGRLRTMETTLAAIPSSRPTSAPMQTSSYGFRRDPFNGLPAFHSGLDFRGKHGQPILATARGRVRFVGRRSGYGKVVEIDHGHGILTRYAHLSGYSTRVGEDVVRGQSVGRMGSTGRSTGTHLHFEVRVNGAAVNPRRFLEAREDVLEIQQLAKQRTINSNRR